jgi:CubicO group peptidase (beta-lactamase class C family)
VALDGYLKSKEGPDATIWEMLEREVYRPIGIFHGPTNSTVEPDGSRGQPLMAFGYYATLDDLAKLALLYQNHGAWNRQQILHRGLVDTLLPTTSQPPEERSPWSGYYLDWWIWTFESKEGTWYLPGMAGFGGNWVTLLPEDLVALQLANTPFTDFPPEWPISEPCER